METVGEPMCDPSQPVTRSSRNFRWLSDGNRIDTFAFINEQAVAKFAESMAATAIRSQWNEAVENRLHRI
jgi:hypothetical protein